MDYGRRLAYLQAQPTPLVEVPLPFWATFCKTVRSMLSGRCPVLSVISCLSVTLVYCGQTVGWNKMPLGTEVSLDLGDIVLLTQLRHGKGHLCIVHSFMVALCNRETIYIFIL